MGLSNDLYVRNLRLGHRPTLLKIKIPECSKLGEDNVFPPPAGNIACRARTMQPRLSSAANRTLRAGRMIVSIAIINKEVPSNYYVMNERVLRVL